MTLGRLAREGSKVTGSGRWARDATEIGRFCDRHAGQPQGRFRGRPAGEELRHRGRVVVPRAGGVVLAFGWQSSSQGKGSVASGSLRRTARYRNAPSSWPELLRYGADAMEGCYAAVATGEPDDVPGFREKTSAQAGARWVRRSSKPAQGWPEGTQVSGCRKEVVGWWHARSPGRSTASRTASRFVCCLPFCDPFGPAGNSVVVNKYGAYWVSRQIQNGFEARRSIQLSYGRASSHTTTQALRLVGEGRLEARRLGGPESGPEIADPREPPEDGP